MLDFPVITFLGGGNMAGAMIQGLLRASCLPTQIRVSEPDADKRLSLANDLGIGVYEHNCPACAEADVVVIAVKPGVVGKVLLEIGPILQPQTLVISIAAGISMAFMAEHLQSNQPIIRTMPNTPALIGAGITVLFCGASVTEDQRQLASRIFSAVGEVAFLDDEALLNAVTALSGSGPAYVYLIAEALSDGGVACGLSRDLADRLTVQTLIGSARLLAETGKHPGQLKNQVTSPSGTTLAALYELEQAGVRGTLMAAVRAAWQRAKELSIKSLGGG
ncbi:MAG: pyrroline-5-carboxylate reductase [Magnetococcus sp. DMHC-6]